MPGSNRSPGENIVEALIMIMVFAAGYMVADAAREPAPIEALEGELQVYRDYMSTGPAGSYRLSFEEFGKYHKLRHELEQLRARE